MTTSNVTVVQAEVLYTGNPTVNVSTVQTEVLYVPNTVSINVASFGLQIFYQFGPEPPCSRAVINRYTSIRGQVSF
jgi:hypothetical protein